MSEARRQDPAVPQTCGCGEGLGVATPQAIDNRIGLPAIAGRIGDHASLRQTLLARLTLSHEAALAELTTRDEGDFSIGLLDAWAGVGDVLTFYQERIANEAYLETATERLSVLELARLIDYRLRPGVAASACLAFTVEDPPGTTRKVASTADAPATLQHNATLMGVPQATMVDAGVKVQSVPAPGETAQTYETVERIEARAAWNAIRPRLSERQSIAAATEELLLEGLATGLRKGDPLLLSPETGGLKLRRVAEIILDEHNKRTRVRLSAALDAGTPPATIAVAAKTPGAAALQFIGKKIKSADFLAVARAKRFLALDVFDNLRTVRPPASTAFALRSRASVFGHNAPKYEALPAAQRIGEYAPGSTSTTATTNPSYKFEAGGYAGRSASWAENKLNNYHDEAAGSKFVYLDAVYSNIAAGSWVVLVDGSSARTYQVDAAVEVSKSDFTLSAKLTRLQLHSGSGFNLFGIRGTSVLAESEPLSLARKPIDTAVAGDVIEFDTMVDGLKNGQKIAVCGELEDERGVTACEIAEIDEVEHDFSDAAHLEAYTRITLKAGLKRRYVRSTVSINANVALATHGETVATFGAGGETLGSGDATLPFQRFTLAQSPLTHVSAATDSGTLSTLALRVQDVLWQEVPTLYGRRPDERVYVTRLADGGKTSVIFGDGANGARLPTGPGNVTANYRKGIGAAGRVAANQLSQLLTRPLGLKSVTNPVAADGGGDPEKLEQARRNAPLAVLTLGRIVSLQDYEDFAAAFAGIAKAAAVRSRIGGRDGVFATVAGDDGAVVDEQGMLMGNLVAAMRAAGDPLIPFTVKSYVPRVFRLAARLATAADLRREQVIAAVEAALRAAFSFDRREFGQPVHASEVVAVMQQVRGVTACALDQLYLVAKDTGIAIAEEAPGSVHPHLPAAAPLPGTASPSAAELLLLDDVPLALGVLS